MINKRLLVICISLFILYGFLYPGIRDGTCSFHTSTEYRNYLKQHNMPEVIPSVGCPIPIFWYVIAKLNGGYVEIQLGHDIYGFMTGSNKWYDVDVIGSLFSNIIPMIISLASISIYYKILSKRKSK